MNVSPTAFLLFIVKRKVEKMAEEKNEELKEETKNEEVKDEKVENEADKREEETSDEIRDNVYANDDIIEMLKSVEKRLDSFDEKLELMAKGVGDKNIITMILIFMIAGVFVGVVGRSSAERHGGGGG